MRMRWLALVVMIGGCGGTQVAPEIEDPELVLMNGALGNEFVVAGQPSEVVSRIRIEARGMSQADRPAINLALVVDTSGSMDGAAMNDARAASLELLDILHDGDRLAVVAFHSETEVLLPSTELGSADVSELRAQIGRMEASGTTDLAGGLQAGLEELVRHFEPEGINRLVLLSDGVPNDPTPVLPLAQAAGERGIRITALGLGLEYDETLLGHIAQRSNGHFHFIEDSSQVASVFSGELLRFERLVGRNLALTLRPGPGVQIAGVVGRSVTQGANGSVNVSLGDMSEGEHRDVIVRMNTSSRRAGSTVELMDAVLSFDDAAVDAGRLERRLFLGARASSDAREIEAGRNEEVEAAAARMVAAATTIQAIETARLGDVASARRILEAAATEAERARTEDEALTHQVAQMRSLSAALPSMSDEPEASYDFAGGDDSDSGGGVAAPSATPPERPSPPPRAVRSAHGAAMGALGY